MELLYLYYTAIFYLGAILGSFLNVVALDIQKLFTENDLEHRNELFFFTRHIGKRYFWQSLLSRRSHCDSCGVVLRTFELFPIISHLLQWGKCRSCKHSIDISHLWVELVCGVYFFGIFHTIFWSSELFSSTFLWTTIFWFVLFGALFVLALFDYRTSVIPDILVACAGILALWYTVMYVDEWRVHLIAGFVFASVFAAMWFISRGRWIGFADLKVALVIGLLLGPSAGLTALAIAFWAGAAVGLSVIALNKIRTNTKKGLGLGSAIPFGPFLVFGAWYVFVTGTDLFYIIW